LPDQLRSTILESHEAVACRDSNQIIYKKVKNIGPGRKFPALFLPFWFILITFAAGILNIKQMDDYHADNNNEL